MRPHIEDLIHYYASARGQRAQHRLQQILTPLLASRAADKLLGLGYCGPYLTALHGKVERVILAHPALQGYAPWPPDKPNCVVQVDDKSLPFPDALYDQVVAIHALEFAEPVRRSLRDIWRVLAPQGRLLLVVPNRTSLMALLDTSPFGNGRPFSAGQLNKLLRDSLFEPLVQTGGLAVPSGASPDSFILRILPRVAGVHIVLAQKMDSFTPTGVGRVAELKPAVAATG